MDKKTQAPQTGATYEYGSLAVQDANGTADGATASESGVSWLDSAALAECRRLTAENAALAERNAELRAALDEQGDELARVRREAASVPTELDGGRLLIVADSIASDGEGLRTIEAYGRFFEREDGGTRYSELFGTPERAAKTLEDGKALCAWCDTQTCAKRGGECSLFDYDALLEWLGGDAE